MLQQLFGSLERSLPALSHVGDLHVRRYFNVFGLLRYDLSNRRVFLGDERFGRGVYSLEIAMIGDKQFFDPGNDAPSALQYIGDLDYETPYWRTLKLEVTECVADSEKHDDMMRPLIIQKGARRYFSLATGLSHATIKNATCSWNQGDGIQNILSAHIPSQHQWISRIDEARALFTQVGVLNQVLHGSSAFSSVSGASSRLPYDLQIAGPWGQRQPAH